MFEVTYRRTITGCLLLIMFAGCRDNLYKNEVEWRLAWRMWESESLDKNYALGAKQFDSLLAIKSNIDPNLLISGIRCLVETNQYPKAYVVLLNNPRIFEINLCVEGWFRPPNTPEWGDICIRMDNNADLLFPQIKEDLLIMYFNDQIARGREIRSLVNETGYSISKDKIYDEDIDGTDKINIEKLKIIIDEIGFPDRKMVGKQGMMSIYTIIRNANKYPEFQASQLKNVKLAAEQGELSTEDYAYLFDRVKLNAGERQVYGTHFSAPDYADRKAVLMPITDEEKLDDRRRELGLMPIELFKRLLLFEFEGTDPIS